MVSISHETPEQTESRLRAVLAAADLVALPGTWTFVESTLTEPPALDTDVLAVVRDEDSWSSLRPAGGGHHGSESFGLLSFHFPPDLDNSGFVGWLASTLKRELGSGVFVLCGSNTARGGIYDYWGYPVELRDDVLDVLGRLRGFGHSDGSGPVLS